MPADTLLIPTSAGVTAATFVARVKAEIHRSRQVDEDVILREMCSALDWYKSHRFFFNTSKFSLQTVKGQAEYGKIGTAGVVSPYGYPEDLIRVDYLRITVNSSTYTLRRQPYQHIRDIDSATNVSGYPSIFAMRDEKMIFYPTPNADDLLVSADYVQDVGTPSCLYSGSAWVLYNENGGETGLTWTSPMLQNAEELIRHRTKAGIYANLLVDVDRANACRVQESEALENLVSRGEWLNDFGAAQPWY